MQTPPRTRLRPHALAAVLAVAPASAALADTVVDMVVQQITDPMATSAHQMFRFEPQIVRVDPGDTVTFRNSLSDHTVHSIRAIWPDGAPEVRISNQASASVTMEQPGVYGITCARHGQYGMVMLILVGEGDLDAAAARVEKTRLSPTARREMHALIEAARESG